MAETITIPSPSVFLEPSPHAQPAPPSVAKSAVRPSINAANKSAGTRGGNGVPKRRTSATKQAVTMGEETAKPNDSAVAKRKQSKSRNGCITCKAKRLKCDETKPTCQQCARRSVTCGGYKKDFKWRPFEETNYTAKAPPGKVKKASSPPPATSHPQQRPDSPPTDKHASRPTKVPLETMSSTPTAMGTSFPSPSQLLDFEPSFLDQSQGGVPQSFDPELVSPEELMGPSSMFDKSFAGMAGEPDSPSKSPRTSPRLEDLLPFEPDMDMSNVEYVDIADPFQMIDGPVVDDEGDIEDIIREEPKFASRNPDHEAWVMRLPTPAFSTSSSSSSDATVIPNTTNPWTYMVREPLFSPSSPEMLTLRFDRQTCGVLSIKDGPTENPWRTLIWPLARDNTALYHAIASMTSFHYARESPDLRVQGIEHMRTSIKALSQDLANMRLETSIATTLALAFSESWDRHISTGINHIKGAKILVNQALTKHRQRPYGGEELARFKFLANTWIYMDVLARLTSVDDDESNDFDNVFAELSDPWTSDASVDPLMGCASTLFPIIGRVTNLVRKVRRLPSNSPGVISQALELKAMLQCWVPPTFVEAPEDPESHVDHSLQTAEAYRWATLLYLHQAVPEIPSQTSAELAREVMVRLATVPIASRTIIVQIFPLIAAGCEAVDEEDREWVRSRWTWMSRRMKLGNIDRCAEVVKEVWDRRDAYEPRSGRRQGNSSIVPPSSLKRGFSMNDVGVGGETDSDLFDWSGDMFGVNIHPGGRRATAGIFDASPAIRAQSRPRIRKKSSDPAAPGGMDPEFTVRGSLHWIGVMKDWNWEVLLG